MLNEIESALELLKMDTWIHTWNPWVFGQLFYFPIEYFHHLYILSVDPLSQSALY